jgi:toxin YhaV
LSTAQTIVINGWQIFAHPLFLEQFAALLRQVEQLRQKDPQNYQRKSVAKRLAAITHLAFEVIPQDPSRSEYRQGATLGDNYKHWFRAKFFQQYRLFFRFHQGSKIIVLVWINDEATKRAYGSKTDAYRVFQKMLDSGHPPDDWNNLLQEAKAEAEHLAKIVNAGTGQ